MSDTTEPILVTNPQLKSAFQDLQDAVKKKIPQFIGLDEPTPSRAELEDATAYICDQYVQVMKQPHPREFDPPAAKLREVAIAYGASSKSSGIDLGFGDPDFNALRTAPIEMRPWRGEFGEAMRYDYLEPLPSIIHNHAGVCLYQLDRTITLGHIYARYRWDAWNTATQATAAVEALTESHSSDVLIAMAAVISAGTAFAGIGGVIAAGVVQKALTLGGSALIIGGTLGGALGPSDAPPVPLGGNHPWEVMKNIERAFAVNEQLLEDELADYTNEFENFAEVLDEHTGAKTTPDHPLRPITPTWSGDIEEDLSIPIK